jgi:hypothetical protein
MMMRQLVGKLPLKIDLMASTAARSRRLRRASRTCTAAKTSASARVRLEIR